MLLNKDYISLRVHFVRDGYGRTHGVVEAGKRCVDIFAQLQDYTIINALDSTVELAATLDEP